MNRARLVCAVTLVATVGLAGCGSESGGERAAGTFTSPMYDYTVAYPEGWSVIPAEHQLEANEPPITGGGATDILGRNADRKVSKMDLPAVVIGAQEVESGTTLAEWKTVVVGIVRRQKGCARPSSSERLLIGGERAVLLTYPNCPVSSGLYHRWTVVVHQGRGYQIVWFDHSGQEAEDRPALADMLASLSFTS
jgi:hypothetical protein